MSTKTKLIVAAALALGAVSVTQAPDRKWSVRRGLCAQSGLIARSGLDQRADRPPARANNDASVD
jgi:hypothetical protein